MQESAQHLPTYGDEDKYGTEILVRIRFNPVAKKFVF